MMPTSERGRYLRLSVQRQWVCDLLHFARMVPSVPVQRRISVAWLRAAREAARPRPCWAALFARAFALVARGEPAFRRAYLGWPSARLYEHPTSVASVAISREIGGEPAVLFVVLKAEGLTAAGIDAEILRARSEPPERNHNYRMLRRLSRLPRFARRGLWWAGLNLSGERRAREFGTFGVSAYSSTGAESLHPISPLTTLLNYGPISPEGLVDVRLVYDHRVMDGLTVASGLARLEEVLNTDVLGELTPDCSRAA